MALPEGRRVGQHFRNDKTWRAAVKTVSVARWDELKRHAAVRVQLRVRIAVKPIPAVVVTRFGQISDERNGTQN